jgi:hypothetical protein
MPPMNPRLLRPLASSGFSPKSIAGLAVWLDASVDSSVLRATGTDDVEQWNDLSGNNRNAVQTTPGNRPTYTTTLNGRKCISFGDANQNVRLVLGDLSAVFPTFGEVFMTYAADNDTTYSVYATRSNADVMVFNTTSHFYGTFLDTRVNTTSNGWPTNGSALLSIRASGTSIFVRRDRSQVFTSSAVVYAAGNDHTIGNRSGGGGGLLGRVGEVILFNQDIGTTQRSRVEDYLRNKWGTP